MRLVFVTLIHFTVGEKNDLERGSHSRAAGESSWLESSNYLQERRLLAVDQADLYQDSGRKSSGLLETGTESRDVGNRVLGYTRDLIFLS